MTEAATLFDVEKDNTFRTLVAALDRGNGGGGSGGKGGNGGNGGRGGGGGRDPFEEMSRALMAHMHTLHQGFAEHVLGLINALVQGHAELKDENKELRRRIEQLEAVAGKRRDIDP
jgi:hypothetical protein